MGGITGKGETWQKKPPDTESAFGADFLEVRAFACPVHVVFGFITFLILPIQLYKFLMHCNYTKQPTIKYILYCNI
jgi:hypothetical protein